MRTQNFMTTLLKLITTTLLLAGLSVFNSVSALESGGHSGGHSGGSGHSGGHSGGGGHDSGHDHDDGDSGEHSGHGGRRGRHGAGGGHGHSHDVATDISSTVENRVLRGRRPVWAQEGIPEVELGRLNVGRAPGFVLARAENEALKEFTDSMASLYQLSAEEAATLFKDNYNDLVRIHSPVQNLALYKDIMTFNQTQLPGVTPASTFDLAAIFLGSASDKNIPISENSVIAINRILGLVEMNQEDIATLANKAESVRASILIGHGDTTHSDSEPH